VEGLRVGILGAARIAPAALIKPARSVPEVTVAAVAARDADRASAFARKHSIATVHPSYDALIADPSIDAIYNPLPNALHAPWTLRALEAGKHVLCEKPFTSNAREAEEVAAAAKAAGRVVVEAFHYRYHPLADRMASIAHGELGEIREVRTALCFPLPRFSDIRYNYALGGGALMDAGCYALNCLRLLGPGEPEVVSAQAKLRTPQVDRAMSAELRFPGGARGRIDASMWSRRLLGISARVTGDRGEMRVTNFVLPHTFHRLTVRVDGQRRREKVKGEPTYLGQLRSFVGAVLRGEPVRTPPEDAVVNMRLIDDIYRAAGLPLRGEPAG
jgi:predicted dehydrogenase